MIGERQVGQVVVPDRVVQAERFVAFAPLVAGTLMLVDDQRRHAEALEPRAKPDAGLPAADHETIGLALVAELGLLGRLALEPGPPPLLAAVLHSLLARRADFFFMALELAHGGQQGPALVALEPDVAMAASHMRLESEPTLGDSARLARVCVEVQAFRPGARERAIEHGGDRLAALGRLDVPGEGDEVAPIALLREHAGRALDIPALERFSEDGEPF